jgi:hypothetical protein
MLIWHITVCVDAIVNFKLVDQPGKILFGMNGNTLGIKASGKLGRILAALDVRNLGGGKGNDVVSVIVPVVGVKVVKIPACRADDDNILF